MWAIVVGSVTSIECVFAEQGRRPEPYIATIHRFGLDLGVTGQTRLTWAVNAPTGRFGAANSPAITAASAPTRRSASASAAISWSAVRTIPMRCSRSACKARPASMSPPASPTIELEPVPARRRRPSPTVITITITITAEDRRLTKEARASGPFFCARVRDPVMRRRARGEARLAQPGRHMCHKARAIGK